MILIDAGPLVAMIDAGDPHHKASLTAVAGLPCAPMLATWPCFTEAMYLLGSVGGHRFQAALWRLRSSGRLALHDLTDDETDRMAVLMENYQDVPMDLADASLVAVAETLRHVRVLTLDNDFFIYRTSRGTALDVIRCAT